jgi:hypothetical protein
VVDIFDEVSGDLRAERAAVLLRRYGGYVIAAAFAVLLAVAGAQIYAWHRGQAQTNAASQFLAITGPLDTAGAGIANTQAAAAAAQLTSFAANAPAGYRSLARLRAAALYANAGQPADAAAQWDAVAADGQADPILRDLANLLWAQHQLGTAPDAAVSARLAPLAQLQNPWHGLAQETQGLMYLRERKTDLAKAVFNQIASDPTAPDGARNRAAGLLAKLNG